MDNSYQIFSIGGLVCFFNIFSTISCELNSSFLEIIINNYDKDPNGLEEILYHETKHIWDDYIEITKHNKLLVDKVNKSILTKLNKTNIDETIKQLIY